MEWHYQGLPVTDEMVDGYTAFVYVITNIINGRKYIGKKRLQTKRKKPPLKGQKRKRTVVASSDWRDYYGSNDELNAEIEKIGSDKFLREITHLCKTLSESTYYEAKEQFVNDVLLKPEEYYNAWIMARVRRDHLVKKVKK